MKSLYWIVIAAFLAGVAAMLILGAARDSINAAWIRLSLSVGLLLTCPVLMTLLARTGVYDAGLHGTEPSRGRIVRKIVHTNSSRVLSDEETAAAVNYARCVADAAPLQVIFMLVMLANIGVNATYPSENDIFDLCLRWGVTVVYVGGLLAATYTIRRAQRARQFLHRAVGTISQ